MKNKNEYGLKERVDLVTRYRKKGELSSGTTSALKWYKKGIAIALKGAKFDQKNYEYYYDYQEHYEPYERKGLRYFEEAARCFKRSADLGNELAMMNYAVYLFSFKEENRDALKWFVAASDKGLAVADYELSVFYRKGYCGVEVDEDKSAWYYQRYKQRCAENERQLILAWDIDEDRGVIGRAYMYGWFCGYSFPEIYDTPHAKPSKWKYSS